MTGWLSRTMTSGGVLLVVACALSLQALGGCYRQGRCCADMYELETTLQPDLVPVEPMWNGGEVTVHWECDTCLHVETRVGNSTGTVWIQDLCFRFGASEPPVVHVTEWEFDSHEGAEVRYGWNDIRGTAVINTNGAGLGAVDGPDLVIQFQYHGIDAVSSPTMHEGGLLIPRDQLVRSNRGE